MAVENADTEAVPHGGIRDWSDTDPSVFRNRKEREILLVRLMPG